MPKSTTSTPGGSLGCFSSAATATPKPSSPKKMLPIPATSTRLVGGGAPAIGSPPAGAEEKQWAGGRRACHRLDLVGREEEPVAGAAVLAQLATRVVLERHGHVHLPVEVRVQS